jgi:UDP-N-acetylmuramate dehydrogenase
MGQGVELSGYTTLGLGGPAASFAEPGTDAELIAAVRSADQFGDPLLVLGGGSNLVVSDDGFAGTVLHVASRGVALAGHGGRMTVTAAAGENWDSLTAMCAAEGLAGLECLAGIPGLVGATPIQNVGAYGQEVAETITQVRCYDRASGEVVTLTAAQCGFGYRTSMFKQGAGWPPPGVSPAGEMPPGVSPAREIPPRATGPTGRYVVLGVTFTLAREPLSGPVGYAELARTLGVATGDRVPLADARAAVLGLRRGKGMVLDAADPDTRSAGSFFTNPVLSPEQFGAVERVAADRFGPATAVPRYPAPGGAVKVPAAWLIERSGFTKGYPGSGTVRISSKHTLALVNRGDGSTKDLLALATEIRDAVRSVFGVELVPEPVLVGASL